MSFRLLRSFGAALPVLAMISACANREADLDTLDEATTESAATVTTAALARATSPVGCLSGDVQAPAADGSVLVAGEWKQAALPASLTVGGKPVIVGADKRWSLRLPAKVGLNTYRAVSRDSRGKSFNNICAVYAANKSLADGAPLKNAVSLGLRQGAIDDGAPNLPIGSIGDVARAVIQSPGLHALIDEEIDSVAHSVYLAQAIAEWRYEYRDIRYDAPEDDFDLVDDGIRVHVGIKNLRVDGKLLRDGPLNDSRRDLNVKLDHAKVDFIVKPKLVNGRIEVTAKVVPGSADVALPDISSERIIGVIVEVADSAARLFEGPITKAIERALVKQLEKELPEPLENLLNGAATEALRSTNFTVPNVGRAGMTRLTVEPLLSDVHARKNGTFSVSFDTKIKGFEPAGSVGAPLAMASTDTLPARFEQETSDVCGAPSQAATYTACVRRFESESAGAVSPALAGQALRALWRAGYFDIEDVNRTMNLGLGKLNKVSLKMLRPPMVLGTAEGVRIMVGPIKAAIQTATFAPLDGDFYARVDVPVTASTNGVAFGAPEAVEVEFDPRAVDGPLATVLPPAVETIAETALKIALTQALGNVGPFFLPSYEIPTEFEPFGLPPRAKLGVTPTDMEGSPAFLTFVGRVGQLGPRIYTMPPRPLAPPAPPLPSQMTLDEGMDRPGSDYRSFALDAPAPTVCAQTCAGEARCKAFSYVPPGMQRATAVCYLKDAVPAPVAKARVESGIRQAAPAAPAPESRDAQLKVVTRGDGHYGGTVTSSPAGIACTVDERETSTCVANVRKGDVTLRVEGAAHWGNFSISGCTPARSASCSPCEGRSREVETCKVNLDRNLSIDVELSGLL